MKIIPFILIFVILFPLNIASQEHNHVHARNEIGISPGVTYSPSHENWGFGTHVHYFRTLGAHSPWALGGSVEGTFTHESHWTLSAGAKYQILDRLNLAVMPGITFLGHHGDEHPHDARHADEKQGVQLKFSIHFELVYDLIHWEHFHLGPAIDYSWSRNDTHFMLGVHFAYAF